MLGHLGVDGAVDCLEVVLYSLRDHLVFEGEVGVVQSEELIVAEVRLSGMLHRIVGVR